MELYSILGKVLYIESRFERTCSTCVIGGIQGCWFTSTPIIGTESSCPPQVVKFQSKTLIFLKEYDNIGTILSRFTIK